MYVNKLGIPVSITTRNGTGISIERIIRMEWIGPQTVEFQYEDAGRLWVAKADVRDGTQCVFDDYMRYIESNAEEARRNLRSCGI